MRATNPKAVLTRKLKLQYLRRPSSSLCASFVVSVFVCQAACLPSCSSSVIRPPVRPSTRPPTGRATVCLSVLLFLHSFLVLFGRSWNEWFYYQFSLLKESIPSEALCSFSVTPKTPPQAHDLPRYPGWRCTQPLANVWGLTRAHQLHQPPEGHCLAAPKPGFADIPWATLAKCCPGSGLGWCPVEEAGSRTLGCRIMSHDCRNGQLSAQRQRAGNMKASKPKMSEGLGYYRRGYQALYKKVRRIVLM